MEFFETLASFGITTKVLQIGIIAAIVIVLAGIFWKYLVVGAGLAFCVAVFAMPSSKTPEVAKPEQVIIMPEVKQIEPAPPVVEVKPEVVADSDESMFLEDCNLHSGYTKSQCKALWESEKSDIQKSNWKYKNKRTFGMQKVKYGV